MARPEPDELTLVRLLWDRDRHRGVRPGPRPGLTVGEIVRVGIEIADARSGPGLSMRTLAQRLGRTPMALYPYIGSLRVLLQLMYDEVHAELVRSGTVQDRVVRLADLYARHHWLSEVSWSRPVLGPQEQATLEGLLAVLPERAQRADVVSVLFTQARATGRLVAEARFAPVQSGTSDEDWWRDRTAAMQEVVPDFVERYPRSAQLGGVPEADLPSVVPAEAGYLERSAWQGLLATVDLVLAGAA